MSRIAGAARRASGRWPERARWRSGLRRGGSAAFAFGAQSLQQVSALVLTLLAARFLVPAEYGIYTLSALFVGFVEVLIYAGLFHYVVRAKGDERAILDTCFWMILGFATLGTAALWLAAPAIARAFDAPELALVLRLLALLNPLAAVAAWCSSVLMRQGRMTTHFNILIAQNLIGLVGGVAILVAWQSVLALVAYRALRAVAAALLYAAFGRVRPGLSVRWDVARDAARYASHLYGTRILNFIAQYGADLALGLLYTTAEAGLYRFGSRIATGALDVVAQPMRSFALAQFGAAHRQGLPFGPVLERFSSTMLVLMGCVAGTIAVFGEDVVRLLFEPAYAGGLVVLYALTARALLGLGNAFVEPVLAAKGRTGLVLRHQALWTTLQTASIPLVAGLGLGALAWSRAAVALATSAAGLHLIARAGGIGVRPVLRATAKAALFALAYTLVAAALRASVGAEGSALLLSLALAALAGTATLLAAIHWRVLELRVFSG